MGSGESTGHLFAPCDQCPDEEACLGVIQQVEMGSPIPCWEGKKTTQQVSADWTWAHHLVTPGCTYQGGGGGRVMDKSLAPALCRDLELQK